jgi:hypothetical protein
MVSSKIIFLHVSACGFLQQIYSPVYWCYRTTTETEKRKFEASGACKLQKLYNWNTVIVLQLKPEIIGNPEWANLVWHSYL